MPPGAWGCKTSAARVAGFAEEDFPGGRQAHGFAGACKQGKADLVFEVMDLGGDWGLSAYNAAKGAVTNFTRALALEYGSRGVRINAVAPSLTSTAATVDLEKSEAALAAFRDRLPIGRAATPEEVAGVIAFLASDDARFVNGVILPVDGGLHASNGQPNFLAILGQG